MDPFNPTTEYNVPKAPSNYLKFEEGDTEFLPLDSAIIGYEYWNAEGKPVRSSEPFEEQPQDIRIGKDGNPEPIKHFWAFPVFDFSTNKVKVLEITQKTVMTTIRNYAKNPKWGNPVMKYSFTVNRDDSQQPTKYTIMANPATEIPVEIREKWEMVKANGFDLTRLYTGGDPFKTE